MEASLSYVAIEKSQNPNTTRTNIAARGTLDVQSCHKSIASPVNELITPNAVIQTRPSTARPRPPFDELEDEEGEAVARMTGVVPLAPAAPLVLPAAAAADPLDTAEAEDEEEEVVAW